MLAGELDEANGLPATVIEALASSDGNKFHQLLDALPAAIYTTDAAGTLTFYNRAAADLAGREPRIGSDCWCVTYRLFRPDGTFLPHEECPMAIALRENRSVRGVEIIAERPDGARVPCLPFPTPVRDAEGLLLGAINMIVDISERKQAEARHEALLTELNHRVKNNMQILDALLRSAQRRTQNPEARLVLADAGRRVAAMSAAQQVLYDTSDGLVFDAAKFLEAVSAPLRRRHATQMAVTLETDLETLPNDVAMPLALIVNELFVNAVTHGLNGRERGRVEIRLTRESGEYLLRVEDDGPGFALTKPREQAAGLGLVQGLVEQLGGSFEVKEPGACCLVRFADCRIVH